MRVDTGPLTQCALRDMSEVLDEMSVYTVNEDGRPRLLGTLIPLQADGYVMRQEDGVTQLFDGLPWWLYDMRPQGFLGRLYASQHADEVGLPASLSQWNDLHALRVLRLHGDDATGCLLLGDRARERFLTRALPVPLNDAALGDAYARLSDEVVRGGVIEALVGGEQPKFTAFSMTADDPHHMLIKFSLADQTSASERWRDLLQAEHIAAETLRAAGAQAVRTRLFDHSGQRFLEIERFDRVGASGRRGLFSLAALDAEFVGIGTGAWSEAVNRLAAEGHVRPEAGEEAALLHAFGTLIGNTDMHFGNLSFISEGGQPYALAPAYDMLPMGFAPRRSGDLPTELPEPSIVSSVVVQTWIRAEALAWEYLRRLHQESDGFSTGFSVCLKTLERHIARASERIEQLV